MNDPLKAHTCQRLVQGLRHEPDRATATTGGQEWLLEHPLILIRQEAEEACATSMQQRSW
jgi:hypothetical protein